MEYAIAHYGIKGQQWGVRRYQNLDGTLTEEGKRRNKHGAAKSAVAGLASGLASGYKLLSTPAKATTARVLQVGVRKLSIRTTAIPAAIETLTGAQFAVSMASWAALGVGVALTGYAAYSAIKAGKKYLSGD